MINKFKQEKYGNIVLLILLLPIFYWVAISIINSFYYPDSDFSSFWVAGKMILMGGNFYNLEEWNQARTMISSTWFWEIGFLYPFPLGIIFASIAWIPYKLAFILWLIFTQGLIVGSGILLFANLQYPKKIQYFIPFMLGVAIFRSTYVVLRLGQLTGVLLFLLCLTIYYWEKRRWYLGGLLFGILILKPSIGGILILLVGVWLITTRNWAAIKGVITSTVGLLVLGWLVNPSWVSDYLVIGQKKLGLTFGVSPTMWGLVNWTCKDNSVCSKTIPLIIIAILAILFWQKVMKSNLPDIDVVGNVFAIAIPVGLFVTPYLWAYDQLLLIIPVYYALKAIVMQKGQYLVGSLLMPLISISAFVYLALAYRVGRDYLSALVTIEALWAYLYFSKNQFLTRKYTE
jgi:hypothetical protein